MGEARMKTVIVYPVPLETPEVRELFRPFVKRFADSLRLHDPGCEYELAVIFNSGTPDDVCEAKQQFYELPVTFDHYEGRGYNTGAVQNFVHCHCGQREFVVGCSTRIYAYRRRWLSRLVEMRELFGPGLYATSVSRESGRLHACLRCFGADGDLLKRYPRVINSPEASSATEIAEGNLYEWFKDEHLQTRVVYWDNCPEILDVPGAFCQSLPDTFRRGDQSQMLVFDKHTDAYRDADELEKRRLESICFG